MIEPRRSAALPPPGIRAVSVLIGAGLVSLLSGLSIASPAPSLVSPYSLTVVLPYWIWGPAASLALYPLLMVLTSAGLLAGRIRRPLPAACILAIFGPLSLFFTVWGIRPGLGHYGASHTLGILAINVLMGAVLVLLLARTLRRPTFNLLLAFHGLLWGWIAWGGLPWLRQLL